jgi:DNA-binding IscR family transcriptional regulator
VTDVIQSPLMEITVETMQQVLGVPPEIANRILNRLSDAGLLRETQRGFWLKVTPIM